VLPLDLFNHVAQRGNDYNRQCMLPSGHASHQLFTLVGLSTSTTSVQGITGQLCLRYFAVLWRVAFPQISEY
jgi:hypothetical protein